MISLCSSLSVSFNSSRHFHLYSSNASLAQVCSPPEHRRPRSRGQRRGPRGRGRAGSGSPGEVWAGTEGTPTARAPAWAKASPKPRALTPLVSKQTARLPGRDASIKMDLEAAQQSGPGPRQSRTEGQGRRQQWQGRIERGGRVRSRRLSTEGKFQLKR